MTTLEERRLAVLCHLADGRTHPTMATVARMPFLRKMEEDDLIFSTSRYGGRHRHRDWSITETGLDMLLTADARRENPISADQLRRWAAEHRTDAALFASVRTGCEMAAALIAQAEIYERHLALRDAV